MLTISDTDCTQKMAHNTAEVYTVRWGGQRTTALVMIHVMFDYDYCRHLQLPAVILVILLTIPYKASNSIHSLEWLKAAGKERKAICFPGCQTSCQAVEILFTVTEVRQCHFWNPVSEAQRPKIKFDPDTFWFVFQGLDSRSTIWVVIWQLTWRK